MSTTHFFTKYVWLALSLPRPYLSIWSAMKKWIIPSCFVFLLAFYGFAPQTAGVLINDADTTVACIYCKGSGHIPCSTCNGTKVIKAKADCPDCKGRGGFVCSQGCDGTGYIACPYPACTQGSITKQCTSFEHGKTPKGEKQCEDCKGTGVVTVPCPRCKGKGDVCHTSCSCTGEMICKKCHGKKYLFANVACQNCSASGNIKCSHCDGTGMNSSGMQD